MLRRGARPISVVELAVAQVPEARDVVCGAPDTDVASPMRQRSTPVDGSGTTRGATSAPSPAAALSTDQAVRSGVSQRRLPRPGHLALARADLHHFCFSSTATLLRE